MPEQTIFTENRTIEDDTDTRAILEVLQTLELFCCSAGPLEALVSAWPVVGLVFAVPLVDLMFAVHLVDLMFAVHLLDLMSAAPLVDLMFALPLKLLQCLQWL